MAGPQILAEPCPLELVRKRRRDLLRPVAGQRLGEPRLRRLQHRPLGIGIFLGHCADTVRDSGQ